MVLPTNIDATYPDASAADGVHQQYHDEIHSSVNAVVGAYNSAVAGGFVGSLEDWLDQVGTGYTPGGTDVAVADGGTGASTAATARTNLGLGNVDNTSDAAKPVSTAQQTALDAKVSILNVPVAVVGTTDTLASGDNGKINRYTEATLVTVTLPTDVSVDLADGFNCTLVAEGAGGLTLSTTGITITGSANTTIAQGEALVVIKTATADTWLAIGGTSA